jgi:predicted transposase YbfD/YdcC
VNKMSNKESLLDIAKYFSGLDDPRIDRQKLHALPDILLIAVCGAICGAESWRDFTDFGESKIDFLRKYTPLENGIPSKNTFNRVISSLDPEQFKACFSKWVSDFQSALGRVIAIDGKTLRRSFDGAAGTSAIHMVSAFASEARLVLAQQKVADKSNEITAIPKLLDLLALDGAVVTIDAMGCQKAIAKKIIERGGHYVLAVKGNQGALHSQITKHFNNLFDMQHNKFVDTSVMDETSRGRCEVRKCLATEKLDWLEGQELWADLKTCAVIESERTIGEKTTTETRYYISSVEANAESLNQIIRAHWGVENSLHWVMDVVFGEDYSRVRTANGAENMSTIKHVALNKLQAAKPQFKKDMSIKRLRKKAGWDDETLDMILRTEI